MRTAEIEKVLSWIRTTDLVEVGYREKGNGFSLSTPEAPRAPSVLESPFQAVCSPAVGVFHPSRLGEARKAEGSAVSQGELLGVVETARGSSQVKAPCSGRLARVFAEAESPVGFGQPLFFIEP